MGFINQCASAFYSSQAKLRGLIFPSVGQLQYRSDQDKSSFGAVEDLIQLATHALKGNLSYWLERGFRERLLSLLIGWSKGEMDFGDAKANISREIQKRGRFARAVVPFDEIQKLLSSFGFFSLWAVAGAQRQAKTHIPLSGKVKLVSRAVRSSSGEPVRLWRDLNATIRGVDFAYSQVAIEAFIADRNRNDMPSRDALIVGPSEASALPRHQDFDERLLLVTPSSNIQTLEQRTQRLEASWIINSAFASKLCDPQSSSSLIPIANFATRIFCNETWIERIRDVVDVPVLSYSSSLMDQWAVGSPNLLHRALGLTLTMKMRATIVGANLYISDNVYQQTIETDGVTSVQPQRALHEFFTCASYADHGPQINFLAAKRLFEAGWIIGDERVCEILSLDIYSYLLALEESLGRRRL